MYVAIDRENGEYCCLKIIKNDKDYFDQSLNEIKLLQYVSPLSFSHHLSAFSLFPGFAAFDSQVSIPTTHLWISQQECTIICSVYTFKMVIQSKRIK